VEPRSPTLPGRRHAVLLPVLAFVVAACTIGPFQLLAAQQTTQQPAIMLRRCDEARDVLCVLTFGFEPPDRMIIVLLTSSGLPTDLEAVVMRADEGPATYACMASAADASLLACSGPMVPLGSRVLIEVRSPAAKALLASGEFVLNAFAMSTPADGLVLPTITLTIPPQAARTSTPGSAYPNPSPMP